MDHTEVRSTGDNEAVGQVRITRLVNASDALPMSGLRLATALALFVTIAVGAGLPFTAHADRAVTMWFQRAAPAADAPAATLAFLGDPEVSLLTLIFQDVIIHPGPPLELMRPVAQRERVFLGNPEVVLGLAAVGLILLLVHDKRHGRALVWLIAGAAGVCLVTIICQDVIVQLGQQILGMIGLNSTYGFPSGHVMRTTFLAGTALRRVPALGVTIAVDMAASLVYLGVHSMSEVLAAFCLGGPVSKSHGESGSS